MGPAYDQLCSHAARFRTRTRGRFSVPMTVRVPHGGGIMPRNFTPMHQKPLRSPTWFEGGDARHAVRRQGTVDRFDSRPRPGDFLRTQRIYRLSGTRPQRGVHPAHWKSSGGHRRHRPHGGGLGAMVVEAAKAAEQSDASVELIDSHHQSTR